MKLGDAKERVEAATVPLWDSKTRTCQPRAISARPGRVGVAGLREPGLASAGLRAQERQRRNVSACLVDAAVRRLP